MVDNGSDDRSVEVIREWATAELPASVGFVEYDYETAMAGGSPRLEHHRDLNSPLVVLICATQNYGFALGNSIGADYLAASGAQEDFLLFLNNDTLVDEAGLQPLIDTMNENPCVGLVGPRILDYDDDSEWQWPVIARLSFSSMLVVFTALNRLLRRSTAYKSLFYMGSQRQTVYAVPGSCMLFRSAAWRQIGGFDRSTFLYWEEFIIAEKLRDAGWLTVFEPAAVVRHKVGASTTKLGPRKFIESFRSQGYFATHYLRLSPVQLAILKLSGILAFIARACRHSSYRIHIRHFRVALRTYSLPPLHPTPDQPR